MTLQVELESLEATLGSQDGTINFNDFLTVVGPAT